jgi:ATP-binding cassette subfamily E protein 1
MQSSQKREVIFMGRKRIVVHDRELCRFEKCGYRCIKSCPVNRSGEECIVKEGNGYPAFNEELCIGCGLCVKACDKAGFSAIAVVNLPKELDEDPIHRYGKNQFALYRLPIPKKNMVMGLIGPNGVGKTTVLNILSGNIKPNMGIFKGKVEWRTIIEKFKGTELQDYLEKIATSGVSVGYKPQHVDFIPKMWKGKVIDLLKKHGGYENVAGRLGIGEMLEKEIKTLSGGELQLLAVAAVLSKEYDFYFFDEPSSYLDVRQRLTVAREIRELAKRHEVMVVEHDLAILDYLSDHVHILYGQPGAFGVVSNPYGVRVGINTYLEGFINEENVRFRDKPILFSKAARPASKDRLLTEFTGFEKKFGQFNIRTEPGEIYKGEVIGILGPNSIGKTTFIRMLVGELEADKGKPVEMLLSYKPQRLIFEGEDLDVMEYVRKAIGDKVDDAEFRRVLSALNIERNMDKKMKNLSGGELQAVFIACTLGKEHDILLFDEPSAFLDVEQRLRVAKIIRSHVEGRETSAFVVDHDLQLIDSVADRIMVFEGERGVSGLGKKPCSLNDGMNRFLKTLDITFRRDPQTGRARANKPESQKDREQKENNQYYYSG